LGQGSSLHLSKEEEGCVWPAGEHGIYVDHNDNVYVAGNGSGEGEFPWDGTHGEDSHVLKFSADGTFLLRIGEPGNGMTTSNDQDGASNGTPLLYNPADTEVDPKTNELYIADGYGNHRIVVVDADTGEYKRHWGAYGQNPVDDVAADAVGPYAEDRDAGVTPAHFRNPVHCVRVAKDGLVYVCDRSNNRMQVFDKKEVGAECSNPSGEEGECGFVTEVFIRPDTLGSGSVWDLDTSSDRRQSCLHNVDGTNQHADTISRKTLEILETWGRNGRNAGQFHWVHNVATDSEGNLYTAEVDTGKRAQKFEREGSKGCRGKRSS
jgi:NHL repeat